MTTPARTVLLVPGSVPRAPVATASVLVMKLRRYMGCLGKSSGQHGLREPQASIMISAEDDESGGN